jgi:hypothetical protein
MNTHALVRDLVGVYAPEEQPYLDVLLDPANADFKSPAHAVGGGEAELLTTIIVGVVSGAAANLTSDGVKVLARKLRAVITEWRARRAIEALTDEDETRIEQQLKDVGANG